MMEKEEFRANIMVHKNKMYRFALSYTKSTNEAEDIVQDVLLKLWESRFELNDIRSLEAWCMTLTRNKALDVLKKTSTKLNTSMEVVKDLKQFDSGSETPFQQLSQRESLINVMNIVNELPEKQKAVFLLREIEGYSYLEICETLKVDINQVKVNIFRARQYLKEKMYQIESYGTR
jgi:RNA polymerase sigma-70 factor (ECF subfamily)